MCYADIAYKFASDFLKEGSSYVCVEMRVYSLVKDLGYFWSM